MQFLIEFCSIAIYTFVSFCVHLFVKMMESSTYVLVVRLLLIRLDVAPNCSKYLSDGDYIVLGP